MLGGEFDHHGPPVESVECKNHDPSHPATAHLGQSWTIPIEEIYQFKQYAPSKVHELLSLDKNPETQMPGHFPLAWCKCYGDGKVFYTALGDRDDHIDCDPEINDRVNSPETSRMYQQHLLGGIQWALRIEK